jgi:hypothetical protein
LRKRKAAEPDEVTDLKADLARIEREQAKLNRERTKLAESLKERAKSAARPKKKKRGPTRRKWKAGRPPIPYPDFTLSPHANGRWQKKILGKVLYFGRWGRTRDGKMERIPGDGWQEAVTLFNAQRDDLYAGRTPRVEAEGLTVRDLCNRFLTVKKHQLDAGDLAPRTFVEYEATANRLASTFGKDRLVTDLASDDFESLLADAISIAVRANV